MRSKFEKFSLVLGGALIGILFTFNLPVFAYKNNPNNLPIDKLRTFAEVFGWNWLFGPSESIMWVSARGFVITPLDTHIVSAIVGLYFGAGFTK